MRVSVQIDAKIQKQIAEVQAFTGEKQAAVIRLALQAGLPLLIDRFQPSRPEGYFSSAYDISEHVPFERKMSQANRQSSER